MEGVTCAQSGDVLYEWDQVRIECVVYSMCSLQTVFSTECVLYRLCCQVCVLYRMCCPPPPSPLPPPHNTHTHTHTHSHTTKSTSTYRCSSSRQLSRPRRWGGGGRGGGGGEWGGCPGPHKHRSALRCEHGDASVPTARSDFCGDLPPQGVPWCAHRSAGLAH
jgi:hypothetical protein